MQVVGVTTDIPSVVDTPDRQGYHWYTYCDRHCRGVRNHRYSYSIKADLVVGWGNQCYSFCTVENTVDDVCDTRGWFLQPPEFLFWQTLWMVGIIRQQMVDVTTGIPVLVGTY